MELLDLPPEIFKRIIHIFILQSGVPKAWKDRQVCRAFAREIYEDTFAWQPISAFETSGFYSSKIGIRIMNADFVLYLSMRMKNPLDVNPYLPTKITEMLVFLEEKTATFTNERREECTRTLFEAVKHGVEDPASLLAWGPGKISKYGRPDDEDTSEQHQLAAAAAVGEWSVVRQLISGSMEAALKRSAIFGAPLAHIVAHGNLELSALILGHFEHCEFKSQWTPGTLTKKVMRTTAEAITAAIRHRHMELLTSLVQWRKKRFGVREKLHYNAWLREAIRTGDPKFVKHVLGFTILSKPRVLKEHFEEACLLGNVDIVKQLIGDGKIPLAPGIKSKLWWPLYWAVRRGGSEVIAAVLEAGGNAPDSVSRGIEAAIERRNGTAIQLLLEKGTGTKSLASYEHLRLARNAKNEPIYELLRQEIRSKTEEDVPPFKKPKAKRASRQKKTDTTQSSLPASN
ncbi:hypothetical protein BDV96DRAFT_54495 [Lophiotrema nucula]|uniref:Ankyrin repeat-containing domain protein n=1 Tax=Lophiotrema nucula TaxID=690887 RepID=A0A6A5ZAE1_9PLEO|nr:hypothetical protein BDV96DRAFT_54495 [Lophiotrema nucula]